MKKERSSGHRRGERKAGRKKELRENGRGRKKKLSLTPPLPRGTGIVLIDSSLKHDPYSLLVHEKEPRISTTIINDTELCTPAGFLAIGELCVLLANIIYTPLVQIISIFTDNFIVL